MNDAELKAHVDALVAARIAARTEKNYAESDRLRDEIVALGIQIIDSKDDDGNLTTVWEVKR